jgi:multidrug efflux pump subunit AcrB
MHPKTDAEMVERTQNTCRFFVEHRQIAWAALIGVIAWGIYGYTHMPQRKDPEIPVRLAVAVCRWPGANAQQVEQLVTRPMEQAIAQNKTAHPPAADTFGIRSISLPGAAFVYVNLSENTKDSREQFSDINLRLSALNGRLPQGASPVVLQSDFGDTAAMMITVASPPVDGVEIDLRARSVEQAIRSARTDSGAPGLSSVSILYSFPLAISQRAVHLITEDFRRRAEESGVLSRSRIISGHGFSGVDGFTRDKDDRLAEFLQSYISRRLRSPEFDPDIWRPVIIRDPSETRAQLASVAREKYSYAQLDRYTDLLGRTLLGVPQSSRVERKGVLPEAIYLNYSQERLSSYGLQPSDLVGVLSARNITLPGGVLQAGGKNILVDPSGRFDSVQSIGDVVVGNSPGGAPVYLRDIVEISRSYQTPADYLNYYTWEDPGGQVHRSRAITIALYMRSGEQIQSFGKGVEEKLQEIRNLLPPDLIIAKTSDQPLQVRESIDLFSDALIEAVLLVLIVALVGFWEWRSALLMGFSIPITLAMTLGMVHMLHIDLQQVSIATLIIALGLLVDDPVVANDAIKRELSAGRTPLEAAWLGPTKLAQAILYATATNIIAYLPFLMVSGNVGDFLYSLPIVMTAALVASRLASMTFVPLLGYYLLRPGKKALTIEERRSVGFYGFYYRFAGKAIRYRWGVMAFSVAFLIVGGLCATRLKTQFFPDDVQYWSFLDIWMPNDAPISLSNERAQQAEGIVRRVIHEYERQHPAKPSADGKKVPLLHAVTSFVGGGGPRFWFSVSPEQQQPNYAQVLIQVNDKEATPALMKPMQTALSREIPGALVTVHQLQTNPVEFPVEVRIFGLADVDPQDEETGNRTLLRLAGQVEDLLRPIPGIAVVHNDWFSEGPEVKLKIDPDRANLAGITNLDVAASAATAISGQTVTVLREGNLQIPVIARLREQERAQLSDIEDLYVYSTRGQQKVPIRSVSSIQNSMEIQRIRRQEHFRMIGIHAYPLPGVLASEILKRAATELDKFAHSMPPGFRMEIGGEKAKQERGFADLVKVLLISLAGIYVALLIQFNSAVKPLLVFAATPYGVVGALISLAIMGMPFGFMAFLGIASLIGVIVSHVIVLFDFIEEMQAEGKPFDQAVRDAGIERLRPVMITVAATILALFPLARHGGPLWQPLCCAQIGGLAVATFVTLVFVPVLYSIFVLDLKIVKWGVGDSTRS